MCQSLNFENGEHKALANRIASGEAVLFLGSGFSMGAIGHYKETDSGFRQPLPNVEELKKILVREILFSEDTTGTLKAICEDCKAENPAKYSQLMSRIFTVSSMLEFHKLYAEINWKSIYTINVDNLVECVYDEIDKEICPIFTSEPINHARGALTYYKLHGDAVHNPDGVVFSESEYVASASHRSDCRFEQLYSDLKTDNFIFVGTSLNEEWDIDIWCEQADIYKVPNKAYFVLKDCDVRTVRRINRRFSNAVFIKETAETFIQKILQYLKTVPKIGYNSSFERWNFRHIKKQDYDVVGFLRPDLYMGAEPTWEDVFSNHDVIWEKTRNALANFRVDTGRKCTFIVGKPVSGKTTMLYRFGVALCEDWMVLEYIGDNFWEDIEACVDLLKKQAQPVLILVDDANWILGRLHDILNILDDKVRLIVTIRQKEYVRRQHLFDEEVDRQVEKIMNLSQLTEEDIGFYLDKLEEKSFLGRYGGDYNVSRQKAIQRVIKEIGKKKEDPLLWLAYKRKYEDEDDSVLNKRLRKICEDIINSPDYNLKRFTVLLYFLDVIGDVGMKLSLFLDLYPMEPDVLKKFVIDIQELLISNISRGGWERIEYNKITIHGRFSEIIRKTIRKISLGELESLMEDICQRLNRKYYYKSRRSNSYQNFVLYTLLRSQNISELFRRNGEQVKWKYISRLYERLHDDYKDYYLYWLHRGISEIRMRQYDRARIHLEQAHATRRGYSYEIEHTFAILYFEQAIYMKGLLEQERTKLFEQGLGIIQSQIGKKTNDAFAIHSFIVKTIQFYNKIGKRVPDDLMKEILEYYGQARRNFEFSQSMIRRNMLKCIYQYLSKHEGEYKYNLSVSQEELEYMRGGQKVFDVNYNVLDLLV